MIADLDEQIGRLMQSLVNMGIEHSTLVVVTSDNGPEASFETDSAVVGTTNGFRGGKRTLYEGGIRVPLLAQWVGTIPPGRVSDVFTTSVDLFPSFLDAAGIKAPSHIVMDGMSILPQLLDSNNE